MDNETLGIRLKKLIYKNGFSSKEFADKCKINPATLSRYINGKYEMSDLFIERAAKVLEADPDYIRGITDDVVPQKSVNINKYDNKTEIEQRFETLEPFLESIGVFRTELFHIRNMEFQRWGEDHIWYPITDVEDEKFLKGLSDRECIVVWKTTPNDCYFEEILRSKGKEIKMSWEEYCNFMNRLIIPIEFAIQDKFNLKYEISDGCKALYE